MTIYERAFSCLCGGIILALVVLAHFSGRTRDDVERLEARLQEAEKVQEVLVDTIKTQNDIIDHHEKDLQHMLEVCIPGCSLEEAAE